ncbi:Zn-ribbon domain-containing OB-fold protein [Pseudarthrobacter siccitolerans]|uniref:Zn-ribbon domain-containing OB-fold protein n=1 Tax=Pseudarthrobacter siccitolerans TaxID=861266 RepID=UPI0009FA1712|nr:OB-fold domain-containing protein [Pseudarthrobacter siccitolerans]
MTSVDMPLREDVVNLANGLQGISCLACQRHSFPQRPLCLHCGSDRVENVSLPKQGRVCSWTVVRQAPAHLKTPYTLVTVDFEDGNRVLGAAEGNVDIGTVVGVELYPKTVDESGNSLWWYRFRGIEETNE